MAAAAGRHLPPERRRPEQAEGLARAAGLVDELVGADAYLFAVPLYNFGVPQHVKAWIDLVITDPRMATGGGQPIAGRPAVLVVVRGGGYGPGTPREGWDHSTPWLRRIFADVWGLDLRIVEAELTLADVNPAMAGLRDLAARSRAAAHAAAEDRGRDIARQLAAATAS
jgi:FMN-dependent NADH-azoreductase